MKSTNRSLAPLALVSAPARDGLAFWLLFVVGAVWGAVLGSALVRPVSAGAPLIVAAFTLGSAFLVAGSGTQWLRERQQERARDRAQERARSARTVRRRQRTG